MKYCPNCQADVEGLLYYCDCCGGLLDPPPKRFFKCGIYELPQCLGFSALVYEMEDAIQPETPDKYKEFLEWVGISMVCYPKWMLEDGNIKNKLYYSAKKKYAGLTIVVDFEGFMKASPEEKSKIVARALLEGIKLLEVRLLKRGFSIVDTIVDTESVLKQYMS